jgi:hypothetical protein
MTGTDSKMTNWLMDQISKFEAVNGFSKKVDTQGIGKVSGDVKAKCTGSA